MAQDVRVILIKLADRLHNMRTIEYLGKQKQAQKARETLEVYAPLAHRLGIHALKWELEDLAFQTLHPRKYAEIKAMVADQRADREAQADKAAAILGEELTKADVPADITGRAKHLYSIYDKMAKRGREFNEIYDLTALRVICERAGRGGDARLLRGARPRAFPLEADAGALQGLHRDAEAQPLPLAAHDGDRARGPAARDPGADAGDARAGRVRRRRALALQARPRREGRRRVAPVGQVAHGLAAGRAGPGRVHADAPHRPLLRRGLRLHAEGRGQGAPVRRDADRLRVRRAHGRRPPDGGREGERAHRPAPLPPAERRLRRDPDLEVGTRAVARLARARDLLARPQQDPAVVPARDTRARPRRRAASSSTRR